MKGRGATLLVLAAALSALVGAIGPASAGTVAGNSAALRNAVTLNGMLKHLREFQAIARANGGTRASGFPGYNASAGYVARKLTNAGWEVTHQPFQFDVFIQESPSTFEQVAPDPVTYVENQDYSTMEYSGSGEVTAELIAVDLTLPPTPEPTSTSGCEAADFNGLNLAGKVALMQRGTCTFREKVDNAEAAGAAGAVIFNEGQEGRTDVIFGTLGTPLAGIPAVDTSFDLGSQLANGVSDGPTGVSVHINVEAHSERRSTQNIIAQTPGGDPRNVVMAGAHLDSVTAGPGINDNGSGSAALLEVARKISRLGIEPKHTLRFAWWGAEEANLVGSTHYVGGLGPAQLQRIALYLNFDMIASPNFVRFIYDGNGSKFEVPGPEGSDAIERTFERYFSRRGLASGQTPFDGRSDYGPFIDVGIPAGGLFTGAEQIKTEAQQAVYGGTEGEAFDPCYHQACDDATNLSLPALDQMADAVAHAVHYYAFSLRFIPRPEALTGAQRAAEATHSKYVGDKLRK